MGLANGETSSIEATNTLEEKSEEREWVEYEIPVPWGVVAGKWWGTRFRQPIIAVHGWQDNCGTYDRLIPLLPKDIPILAIDLPGHGKSSHYPKGMQYYLFWDGISLIRRIVKYHKWSNITLIGHSLGGALSFMYAACFPDEVEKFVSIDIAAPTVRDHIALATKTGDCIDKYLSYETLPKSKMPCYDYDEMIKLVLDAYQGSVDLESAKVLMKRGMSPSSDGKGYHFSRDLRLKVSMMGMFSEEQVMTYATQVRCQVLNIRGIPGMSFGNVDVYPKVIEKLRNNAKRVVYEEVEGTHHLHLVSPERIYKIVTDFLMS